MKEKIIQFILKKKIEDIKDQKKLQSIMLSDDYMVGLYNGLECAIATLENREANYKNGSFRNCIMDNPNLKDIDVINLDEIA